MIFLIIIKLVFIVVLYIVFIWDYVYVGIYIGFLERRWVRFKYLILNYMWDIKENFRENWDMRVCKYKFFSYLNIF